METLKEGLETIRSSLKLKEDYLIGLRKLAASPISHRTHPVWGNKAA